jgi:hypothetical protein
MTMLSPFLCVRSAQPRVAAMVAALGLLTAACAANPDRQAAGPDPADAQVRVPAAGYRPVLSGYVSQRPVEPAPWREQNDRVAPKPKQ